MRIYNWCRDAVESPGTTLALKEVQPPSARRSPHKRAVLQPERGRASGSRTMRMLRIIVVSALLLLPASPKGVLALQRLMDVQQIATDTLRDVALVHTERPTGHLLQSHDPPACGPPALRVYFIAHEYGHIHGGHTGGALLHEGELSALRQRQELDADCYAAAVLAEQDRDAVDAALRFFTRLGPLRHDNYHPTGSQRAARILSCLPRSGAGRRPCGGKTETPAGLRDPQRDLPAPRAVGADGWLRG